MPDPKPLIFCDFDGTVAAHDIGYEMFTHFTQRRNHQLLPDWKAGRISSRDVLTKEAAMVNARPEEIYSFLERFKLDPGFTDFVDLCRSNEIEPIIMSEGLKFYIEFLLKRAEVDGLTILSNLGHLEHNGIRIEFPHENVSCERCGSCKGERIAEFREEAEAGTTVVFVGDGLSDICAADQADVLFAKKDLKRYCDEHQIPYNSFSDFHEVGRRLQALDLLSETP